MVSTRRSLASSLEKKKKISKKSGSQKTDTRPRQNFADRLPCFALSFVACVVCVYYIDELVLSSSFSLADVPMYNYSPWATMCAWLVPYMLMVHVIAPWWSNQLRDSGGKLSPAADARWTVVLRYWNAFLSFASLLMLLGMMRFVVPMCMSGVNADCMCVGRWTGTSLFWSVCFVLSKFAELFDTGRCFFLCL